MQVPEKTFKGKRVAGDHSSTEVVNVRRGEKIKIDWLGSEGFPFDVRV